MKEAKKVPVAVPPQPPVAPVETDLEERYAGFRNEFGKLLAKYELGVGATAKITQDGRIAAEIILGSARGMKVATPSEDASLAKPE